MLKRVFFAFVAASAISACDDSGVGSEKDPDGGQTGSGDGDTDGDQDTGGCTVSRTYPIAGLESFFGETGEFSARWDSKKLTYTMEGLGEFNGDAMSVVTVSTYGSEQDFVEEGLILGMRKNISQIISITNENTGDELNRIKDTFFYDAKGRLKRQEGKSIEEGTPFKKEIFDYTKWDSKGRPIAGTHERDEHGVCSNVPVSISYDEKNMRQIITIDYLSEQVVLENVGQSCGSDETEVLETIFNDHNFAIGFSDDGGKTTDYGIVEITDTAEACY